MVKGRGGVMGGSRFNPQCGQNINIYLSKKYLILIINGVLAFFGLSLVLCFVCFSTRQKLYCFMDSDFERTFYWKKN